MAISVSTGYVFIICGRLCCGEICSDGWMRLSRALPRILALQLRSRFLAAFSLRFLQQSPDCGRREDQRKRENWSLCCLWLASFDWPWTSILWWSQGCMAPRLLDSQDALGTVDSYGQGRKQDRLGLCPKGSILGADWAFWTCARTFRTLAGWKSAAASCASRRNYCTERPDCCTSHSHCPRWFLLQPHRLPTLLQFRFVPFKVHQPRDLGLEFSRSAEMTLEWLACVCGLAKLLQLRQHWNTERLRRESLRQANQPQSHVGWVCLTDALVLLLLQGDGACELGTYWILNDDSRLSSPQYRFRPQMASGRHRFGESPCWLSALLMTLFFPDYFPISVSFAHPYFPLGLNLRLSFRVFCCIQ